jgi:CRP/FNR family cyclic AMP-dependent transcriptional regulator
MKILLEDILNSGRAVKENFNAGDYIFREGDIPQYYYQVVTGKVKLNTFHGAKEFIHGVYLDYSCLGESMLILGKPYPMNAVALTDCVVLKVNSKDFFVLLQQHPHLFQKICSALAEVSCGNLALINAVTNINIK